MKKSRLAKIIMSLVMVFATSFMLFGCGSEPKTFEDYANSNTELQEELDKIAEQNSSSLGKMGVDIKENEVIYSFTYSQTYTAEEVTMIKPTLEKTMETMSSSFEGIAKQLETETEITGITVTVVYNNGDGSELFKQTYSAK